MKPSKRRKSQKNRWPNARRHWELRGVTGSGFIILAATLLAAGHMPVAAVALILGVNRFMSEARALTTLVGNGVAASTMACYCNELGNDRIREHLGSQTLQATNEPERLAA